MGRRLGARIAGALGAVAGVVAGILAGITVGIAAASFVLRRAARPGSVPPSMGTIANARAIDGRLWRSGQPGAAGYRRVAAAGVVTVVDLRAEPDAPDDHRAARLAGLGVVHLPVRDGQPPAAEQVSACLHVVAQGPAPVLVHCGAGVGRTGCMVAAYAVASGRATPFEALRDTLAVGPPSLEQLWWVGALGGGPRRPPAPVVAVSRAADAPRRLWARWRAWRRRAR